MTLLVDKAEQAFAQFVFAHGAGAGMHSDFMQHMAESLCAEGVTVIRFDFSYMEIATKTGKRRPPERLPKLQEKYVSMLSEVDRSLPIFIGGKSMGGRVASTIFDDSQAIGCIAMGYPFHPVGKPEKLRVDHLQEITKPMLVLQGERDTFGHAQEIPQYSLPPTIRVEYLPDGDHSFKPRKASGFDLNQNMRTATQHAIKFMQETLA